MITASRYPLANRYNAPILQQRSLLPNYRERHGLATKRPRSPETALHDDSQKRLRMAAADAAVASNSRDKRKEQRQQERDSREATFREKYSRAFPRFKFYFDTDSIGEDVDHLEHNIEVLGATIEEFFSKAVTHLISNNIDAVDPDKENSAKLARQPRRLAEEMPMKRAGSGLVQKANALGIKIWTTDKLASVMSRCLVGSASTQAAVVSYSSNRTLTTLLESERRHGTSERDPNQRRADYKYFTKGSYFVLIEDIHRELATIAAKEYPSPKLGQSPSWPTLYCHPNSRGPFVEFDEKEQKRWEKTQRAEQRQQKELEKLELDSIQRKAQVRQPRVARAGGDLRRTVSMSNLQRATGVDVVMQDESTASATASGYLASGYIAASGNSVAITSTCGTTSTTGYAQQSALSLPGPLRSRVEVLTSRKAFTTVGEQNAEVMGPPRGLPGRRLPLKKSKSTNSLRLAKRDEGSKPGYCENCRIKFDDFMEHIESRRHRKFAENSAKFAELDIVLSEVTRRRLSESFHSLDISDDAMEY